MLYLKWGPGLAPIGPIGPHWPPIAPDELADALHSGQWMGEWETLRIKELYKCLHLFFLKKEKKQSSNYIRH